MSQPLRLSVSIDDQSLEVHRGDELLRRFTISTATKGMGFVKDSYRTPTGNFRISEKVGDGEVDGTIFKMRVPSGVWHAGDECDGDLVLSRVLRLEGLDPENANSLERNIYIHGTNHPGKLGQPASQGCVRLANQEMIELFNLVDVGTELVIHPATRQRGKLFFFDCDSTLSSIEGIDELARARGEEVFQRVVDLTNAAMNGEVPIGEVFPRRMEMIQPDRAACDEVASLYMETMVPGVESLVGALQRDGWTVVILSGGFAPLIKPLARKLGIAHVEAVPLFLNEDGSYKGYGEHYPTTRNLGKNEIIREWKAAMLPEHVVMMGDGMSDLETRPDVDLFVGFGGVVRRDIVKARCDLWLEDMRDAAALMDALAELSHASGDTMS